MTDIVVRTLTPADAPANRRLMQQAFGRGRAVNPDEVIPEDYGQEVLGAFEGDRLHASVTIRPFTVHWANTASGTLPMGGIAGVATHVEARGRGYIDTLLREALVQMRDAGQVISALYPFAWGFYRKFGWEWVGEKRSVTLPLTQIKATPEGRFVREVPSETAKALLAPVYEAYAKRYHGAFTSESHQWSSHLDSSGERTTFVYAYFPEGGDVPTAYLLWRYDESGDAGMVREFVATTPDGYRALLGLLHYLATQCKTARVTVPANAPLWAHLMHWDMKTQIEPVFQARVVDVCRAMESLMVPTGMADGSALTVRVRDESAPWNNGAFEIAAESGRIHCTPSDIGGTADVTLDIQAFSQAFWGMPDLAYLREAGRIEKINGEAGFETLARLLPASPVWTYDFF